MAILSLMISSMNVFHSYYFQHHTTYSAVSAFLLCEHSICMKLCQSHMKFCHYRLPHLDHGFALPDIYTSYSLLLLYNICLLVSSQCLCVAICTVHVFGHYNYPFHLCTFYKHTANFQQNIGAGVEVKETRSVKNIF